MLVGRGALLGDPTGYSAARMPQTGLQGRSRSERRTVPIAELRERFEEQLLSGTPRRF